jgi:hypothetical protein
VDGCDAKQSPNRSRTKSYYLFNQEITHNHSDSFQAPLLSISSLVYNDVTRPNCYKVPAKTCGVCPLQLTFLYFTSPLLPSTYIFTFSGTASYQPIPRGLEVVTPSGVSSPSGTLMNHSFVRSFLADIPLLLQTLQRTRAGGFQGVLACSFYSNDKGPRPNGNFLPILHFTIETRSQCHLIFTLQLIRLVVVASGCVVGGKKWVGGLWWS